jgi:hypothetical protein
MPVARVCVGKRKRRPFYRQSGPNSLGIIDVQIVVEIDEIVLKRLSKD